MSYLLLHRQVTPCRGKWSSENPSPGPSFPLSLSVLMTKIIHQLQISVQPRSTLCKEGSKEAKTCQNTFYSYNKKIWCSSHSALRFTAKCQERPFEHKSVHPHSMTSLTWLTRISHSVLNLLSEFVLHKTIINLKYCCIVWYVYKTKVRCDCRHYKLLLTRTYA